MKAARFFWTGVAALCIVSGVMGVLIDHNSRLQPAAQEATDEVFQPKLTASAPLPLTHPNTSAQEIRTTTTLPPEHTQTARLVLFIQSDAIADLQVSAGSGPLSLIKSEVEQTDGGYRVFTEFTGLNQDEAYADSNQSLTLSFHTTQPESITVSIETGSSFLLTDTTKYAYNPYSHTFPIKEVQPASPSPTPASQSPAPTTHPLPPNTNPTSTPPPQESDDEQTNQSSSTEQSENTQAATAGSLQCNQVCSSDSDCAGTLTCWSNRCRLPENTQSVACTPLSTTEQAQVRASCNTSCGSSLECAGGLTCVSGSCRLPSNPSSTSCSSKKEEGVVAAAVESTASGTATPSAGLLATTQAYPADPSPAPIVLGFGIGVSMLILLSKYLRRLRLRQTIRTRHLVVNTIDDRGTNREDHLNQQKIIHVFSGAK